MLGQSYFCHVGSPIDLSHSLELDVIISSIKRIADCLNDTFRSKLELALTSAIDTQQEYFSDPACNQSSDRIERALLGIFPCVACVLKKLFRKDPQQSDKADVIREWQLTRDVMFGGYRILFASAG